MPVDHRIYPFEDERCIGTTIEVSGSVAKVNLPLAATPGERWHHGFAMEGGKVGEFVLIEAGDRAILGRIVTVRLPERERLSVEEELGKTPEVNPIGVVQLLASIRLDSGQVDSGVSAYPRLASRVFSAHPLIIKGLAEGTYGKEATALKTIDLASLPSAPEVRIAVSPERLFGRHCAILGATGGGKSWSLARLLEQSATLACKIVLVDATGEHYGLQSGVKHAHFAREADPTQEESTFINLPYSELTESDLMAIFSPSLQSQAPKLRSAMKSLKLAKLEPVQFANGGVIKENRPRQPIQQAHDRNAQALLSQGADFDISKLVRQLQQECARPTGTPAGNFGPIDDREWSYCLSLVNRIEGVLGSGEMNCIFKTDQGVSLISVLNDFFNSDSRILRLNLKWLSYEFNVREIICNAIGRELLKRARRFEFSTKPCVVVVDEAHQFLGKNIGEETNRFELDGFEQIAKGGRKYGLTVCLATQRPRDIGADVLSQMGTMLVHRLTNHEDREIVERAAGDLDRSAASFLPSLSAGQAVLIGVDFPMPVTLQMRPPSAKPDSRGPNYQTNW